jgi:hypothetical protein
MEWWECPECHRKFGRRGQGHACQPGLSIEEYFSTGPPWERPIFDAVHTHLTRLGPIHVEPVQVGIFFKKSRTIIQLRPKTKWVALSFSLARKVDDKRIARKVVEYSGKFHHVVNLREASDVDATVRGWLTECYELED